MMTRYSLARLGSFLVIAAVLTACNLTIAAPHTPIPSPTLTLTSLPTTIPTVTPIPSPTIPTATFTITPTATMTSTPSITPTASPSPFPTVPPASTVSPALDNLKSLKIDPKISNNVGHLWLSVINSSDKVQATVTPGTPPPASGTETVYVVSPDDGILLKVIELPATTGGRVYWSPNGTYMAYFLESGSATGLYVLNVSTGSLLRLFAIDNLNPRGILSEPVWSADGRELTITLTTAYDVDVFSVSPEGENFRNLSQSGSYDFWPMWSPNGLYLTFVSDREVCPSYEPNITDSCYKPDAAIPDGGKLYIYEASSGQVRKLSDVWITHPPQWISATRIGFVSGTRGDPTAGSVLGWVDLRGGLEHLITKDAPTGSMVLSDTWTNDGKFVIYQEASTETAIVVRDDTGNTIMRSTDLKYLRGGFSAAWSPDSQRIVLGGRNSRCPFGIIVTDSTLKTITKASPNPGVCNPAWSPDGKWIAFAGVTQSGTGSDGRFDAYIAAPSGYGTRKLTGTFGGQVRIVGWVGK